MSGENVDTYQWYNPADWFGNYDAPASAGYAPGTQVNETQGYNFFDPGGWLGPTSDITTAPMTVPTYDQSLRQTGTSPGSLTADEIRNLSPEDRVNLALAKALGGEDDDPSAWMQMLSPLAVLSASVFSSIYGQKKAQENAKRNERYDREQRAADRTHDVAMQQQLMDHQKDMAKGGPGVTFSPRNVFK